MGPLSVWGGAPGSYTKDSPQSGLEFVGNVARIPHVSKGVALSPFLNDKVAQAKPLPMVVLDSILVLASGQTRPVPKILGIVFGRAFGLLPRKMPPADDNKVVGSHARRGLRCFERRTDDAPLVVNRS